MLSLQILMDLEILNIIQIQNTFMPDWPIGIYSIFKYDLIQSDL
jgi:hypothetical protein